jgi:Helix-turn-helix domain
MDTFFEGRESDSSYIHMIWRGHTGLNYTATCPAEPRWNLLLIKQKDEVKVTIEGPLTQALNKFRLDESDFLVIKFRLGAFFPRLPVANLANTDALLPEGASKTFWLDGSVWQFPDFENVETFVDRLVREEVLVLDPVVDGVLQNQPQDISDRTVRRRFIYSTGLAPKTLQQIERAQQAATLLGKGTSILDAVYAAGYADQPHLTRSLKRFFGQTPAQIAAANQTS